MKYCSYCGQEMKDGEVFCPKCGSKNESANQYQNNQMYNNDAPSFGFAVLGFFIPLVGLILYLVWMNQYPLKAKSCGKGALIGVITNIVLGICFGIVSAMTAASQF